jgi:hypothetical protein
MCPLWIAKGNVVDPLTSPFQLQPDLCQQSDKLMLFGARQHTMMADPLTRSDR